VIKRAMVGFAFEDVSNTVKVFAAFKMNVLNCRIRFELRYDDKRARSWHVSVSVRLVRFTVTDIAVVWRFPSKYS
jgi:hypothetical protein